jgi:hypothetical protein
MAPKPPTAQGISRLLKAAGFDNSTSLRVPGFHVRADASAVYVGWRQGRQQGRHVYDQAAENRALAEYAEAVSAAGWPAEVIYLAGPLVRVTARENLG